MSSPVLVNQPDYNGWSPIHHCVSVNKPSIDVLDALYCAGADVSLFTTNEPYTPLHCLAQSARLSVDHPDSALSLYQSTAHLIRDLRAPLSARDKDDETCIHMAAEHGNCIDLLMVFLDCDTTGCVRELRNARGLTALEVAKPKFCAAFGENAERLRSVSSLSDCTIRPTASFMSRASLSDWNSSGQPTQGDDVSIFSPSDFDIAAASRQLLTSLRLTSPVIPRNPESVNFDLFHSLLCESSQISHVIFRHFHSRTEEAAKELQEVRINSGKIGVLSDFIARALSVKLEERGLQPLNPGKRSRDSEDSQATMVPNDREDGVSAFMKCLSASQLSIDKFLPSDYHQNSVAMQTVPLHLIKSRDNTISGIHSVPQPGLLDNLVLRVDSSTHNAHLVKPLQLEHELSGYRETIAIVDGGRVEMTSFGRGARQLTKKEKNYEHRMKELENDMTVETKESTISGSAKLKTWLKRKIMPDRSCKLEIVKDVDEDHCASERDVRNSRGIAPGQVESSAFDDYHYISDVSIDNVLRTSHVVIAAASRDLLSIGQCLSAAEQFITLSNRSISRAEDVVKRALKKRQAVIATVRPVSGEDSCDELFIPISGSSVALGYSNYLSSRPSIASLSSAFSLTEN